MPCLQHSNYVQKAMRGKQIIPAVMLRTTLNPKSSSVPFPESGFVYRCKFVIAKVLMMILMYIRSLHRLCSDPIVICASSMVFYTKLAFFGSATKTQTRLISKRICSREYVCNNDWHYHRKPKPPPKKIGKYYSIWGFYWDNGKGNGNYYSILGLYWDNGKENGNYDKPEPRSLSLVLRAKCGGLQRLTTFPKF